MVHKEIITRPVPATISKLTELSGTRDAGPFTQVGT